MDIKLCVCVCFDAGVCFDNIQYLRIPFFFFFSGVYFTCILRVSDQNGVCLRSTILVGNLRFIIMLLMIKIIMMMMIIIIIISIINSIIMTIKDAVQDFLAVFSLS